ncbi:MAG: metal-dependent hydrolase [Promethearchaeota archaeon]|nr:MAG: metal-dependent hydrolase [Candidatus Lokiarchaeota archaeon]
MDTFSHIIIGFLLFAKVDIRLAFFSGFMALFVDLDFFLFPFSRKYPIFEHRGIAHSFPVVILYTFVVSLIFSIFIEINFWLLLGAGLTGSILHITCDSLTNYGTNSLYPLVKKPVKLEIILGVDPLIAGFSIPILMLFAYSYFESNWALFDLIFSIAAIGFLLYFIIHCILKIIITVKFRSKSLPSFWRVKFKIINSKKIKIKDKLYSVLSWSPYNLITNKLDKTENFKLLLDDIKPPLDTDEKKLAYAYNLKPLKRIFSRVDYIVGRIIGTVNNPSTHLFWYSLELDNGRFKMGAHVFLKKNGEFKIKRFYPFINDQPD